jgi:import receptor subunit TOM22
MLGNVAWVLATTALMLAVPVALEVEREGFVIQQETQQRTQQQQAQQVLTA